MYIVLVADSDLTFANTIDSALRSHGYESSTVNDGREAWRFITQEPPDLLIVEAALPMVDGFTLLERMRPDPRLRDLPVIVTVSGATEADVFRGWKLGVDTYQTRELGANPQFVVELLAKVKRIFKSIEEDRREPRV